MDKLLIRGGRRLQGEVAISGAKNAALPELCACLLTAAPVTLHTVPRLQDVATTLTLLRQMGATAEVADDGSAIAVFVAVMTQSGSFVVATGGSQPNDAAVRAAFARSGLNPKTVLKTPTMNQQGSEWVATFFQLNAIGVEQRRA